ncbi:MAG: hypothetical protein GY841_08265, partial [FCB group bacterium]|nr:hypothetical protein [FCB group bacterium]
ADNGNATFADGIYDVDLASHDGTNGLRLGGTLVTSSASELNLLDGYTSILDEDNMASDSATSLATQQSVKAYVDSVTGESTTASNGLTESGDDIQLGGALTGNVAITQSDAETLTFTNAGSGDTTFNMSSTGDFTVQDSGTTVFTIADSGNATFADGAYDVDLASHDGTNGLKLGGTLVSSSAAELNLLDGYTSILDED